MFCRGPSRENIKTFVSETTRAYVVYVCVWWGRGYGLVMRSNTILRKRPA